MSKSRKNVGTKNNNSVAKPKFDIESEDILDDFKRAFEESYQSDVESQDETEYKSKTDSDEESDLEEQIEEADDQVNEDELLEELYGDNDDDILEDDDVGGDEEDAPPDDILMEGGGGDDGEGFDEPRKRKNTSRRKTAKPRLFPFLQKKKRLAEVEDRDPPDYWGFEIREPGRTFILSLTGLNENKSKILEKIIYNATARALINQGNCELEEDSPIFKTMYWNILRYLTGAWGKLTQAEIVDELRSDNWGLSSKLFSESIMKEKQIEDKIRNPEDIIDDNMYPCPKCKGSKHSRLRVVDRAGDEATSLRLWCANRSCGFNWRITG